MDRLNNRKQRRSAGAGSPIPALIGLSLLVILNLMVFGVGVYFFYDQVIAPAAGLKSPQERMDDALTRINSGFREPEEQIAAMKLLYTLSASVPASQFAKAISTVNRRLPHMTVATEVFDTWIELQNANLKSVLYADASSALVAWDGWDMAASAARQKLILQSPLQCDDATRRLVQRMNSRDARSEVERQVAGAIWAKGVRNCGW